MAGKLVFIVLNLGLLFVSQGQIMDDVCHKDDLECKFPNIKQTGELKHGKCQWDSVLRRIHYTSLLECVKECMITSQCVGINYRKNWKTCDVVDGTHSPLKDETGCMYSKIDSWSKISGHKNIQSVSNYSKLNPQKHKEIASRILSGSDNTFHASQTLVTIDSNQREGHQTTQTSERQISVVGQGQVVPAGLNYVFGGPIYGGTFNININSLPDNQHQQTKRRRVIIDSDSSQD